MATSFPAGLDALTNPTSADTLASPDHAAQHANVNDAVEAIEVQIGTTASPVLARLASPTFTGTPTLPTGTIATTQTAADSSTKVATTAFVTTADNLKANLTSPTFTGVPAAPTATAGTNTTQLATTAFVTTAAANVTSGFRNVFINGAMQIAQRGTSSTSITAAGYYTCDRWHMNLSVGGTWTQTQSTDAPAGFSNSLKVQCTTANASLATTNNARIWQKIEGFNVQQLAKGTAEAKPLVLTFWVKAFQTGTFICTLDDLTNSRKISASYTINASATWEKKTLYFAGDTTGALTNDSSATLMPTWWLAAGPSWQGSALSTSWSAGATLSNYADGQTNVASSTNNYFQITGVQLEEGNFATPFEQRPIGVELALCQRYYALLASGVNSHIGLGFYGTATQIEIQTSVPVSMRTSPTIAVVTGTNYYVCYGLNFTADYVNTIAVDVHSADNRCILLYNNSEVSATAGHPALLRGNDAAALVAFSAELS